VVHPSEMMIALGAIGAAAFSIRSLANAVLRYQENKLKYENPMPTGMSDARIERMEQAIDAIAIEIERISENQRFTTKLLTDRPAGRAISGG
jgi:hypothetical protein